MSKTLKRLATAMLIAALLFSTVFIMPAEAAGLKAPTGCRFTKWLKSDFTACQVSWNKVSGANVYQVELAYKSGKNAKYALTKNTYSKINGLSNQHIHRVRVRAYYIDSNLKLRKVSGYSNAAYIVPLPTKASASLVSRTKTEVRLKWNIIYGSNGYNLFLTTNPSVKWYWNKATAKTATASSIVIKKYKGKALKKYVNYYTRIMTRNKVGSSFINVPIPYSGFWTSRFYIY